MSRSATTLRYFPCDEYWYGRTSEMMAMITYDWAALGEEAVRPRACNEPAVQFPIAEWSGSGAKRTFTAKNASEFGAE